MKLTLGIVLAAAVLGAGAFAFSAPKEVVIGSSPGADASGTVVLQGTGTPSTGTPPLVNPPEAPQPTGTPLVVVPGKNYNDLPSQPQLANPPAVVKGIYLTGWSAGSASKVQSVIQLIKNTELNAVVIDIKDYSGYVSYAMDVPDVKASGAENQIRIARPNALIKELHDNGIYVIGRITSFQDPILAEAHPEWAMHNKTTGGLWKDNNGLAWMDPAAKPVWDYLASIGKDAFARGFDEVQFDYVRFASDGTLGNITYPYWDEKTPRATVISNYFKFLRQTFPNNKISADLFGLATINNDDLGIGQVIQGAFEYFDYVSPMVYPSHYASGFLGYKSPAKYPYEVIDYSLEHAITKLAAMGNANSTPPIAGQSSSTASSTPRQYSPFNLGYVPNSKLRPWLQDFNLNGVPYTADMVRAEKKAVYDTLATGSANYYGGWLMWNASNNYTAGALDPQ
jgi:hypothetical protein